MKRRFSQILTYWDAKDADTVIDLLDELREAIWCTWCEEIIEMHRAEKQSELEPGSQLHFEFYNEIEF